MPSPQYAEQLTPRHGADVIHVSSPLELGCFERWFQIGKVVAYFIGSFLFLFGSILYFPKYATLWNGQAPIAGAWMFFVGCIAFLIGTHGDFIDTIRANNTGSPTRRVIRAYNAALYCASAGIFMLGAVFFLPDYYVISASIGCWSFLIGCIGFCLAALIDIVFLTITHENRKVGGIKIANLYCWGTVVALGCFFGALCFILGSWYYLPRYIALEDTVKATHYMNLGITYYTVGSVFFLINAAAQVPDLLIKLKSGKVMPDPKNKDSANV